MEKDKADFYDQKIDIALKRQELEMKYGANFSGDSDLPPEVESKWLDHMIKFEEQYHSCETITVWKFIGEPEFTKPDELSLEKLSDELGRLVAYMDEHNVALDTLCEVDDKELYRFIVEELFSHEMNNIRIPGMMTGFIYEEFHPNAQLDVTDAYNSFFRMTMGKMENYGGEGYELLYIDRENYEDSSGNVVPKKVVEEKINNFLNSFDYFEIVSNSIVEISFNEDQTDAEICCDLEYKGCFEGSNEELHYQGKSIFRLKPCEYGGWGIYHIDMPGLEV